MPPACPGSCPPHTACAARLRAGDAGNAGEFMSSGNAKRKAVRAGRHKPCMQKGPGVCGGRRLLISGTCQNKTGVHPFKDIKFAAFGKLRAVCVMHEGAIRASKALSHQRSSRAVNNGSRASLQHGRHAAVHCAPREVDGEHLHTAPAWATCIEFECALFELQEYAWSSKHMWGTNLCEVKLVAWDGGLVVVQAA